MHIGFTADGLSSSDSANHSLSLWINYFNIVKIINLWWGMLLEERGGVSTVQNKNAQQVQGAVCVANWSMAKLPIVLSTGRSEVSGRVGSLCTEISFLPILCSIGYFESLLMTRMSAPFSSFSRWLSDFSSVKTCFKDKTENQNISVLSVPEHSSHWGGEEAKWGEEKKE